MNYVALSREEEKKRRVAVLKEIALFCDANEITYYLAFGTLLGAVREGGMINWDYDIDVMLPRPDYEVFIKSFKSEFYRVQYCSLNKQYCGKLAIVEDINTINITDLSLNDNDPLKRISVELYPIDGVPNCKLIFIMQEILLELMGKCNTIKTISVDTRRKWYKNCLLQFLQFIMLPINNNWLVKAIHKLSSNFKYEESKDAVISCIGYKFMDTRHNKELYEHAILLQYEDQLFWVPEDYDLWLSKHYGDYMSPPPKRDIEHSLKLRDYYEYGVIKS